MQRVIDERCAGPRPPGGVGWLDGATGARGPASPDDAGALALTFAQHVARMVRRVPSSRACSLALTSARRRSPSRAAMAGV